MLNHDVKRNAISIRMYSAETTGPIFTKILHDIVALLALFDHAYTWRYPIPFLNGRATNVQFAIFARNVPSDIGGPDRSLARKALSYGKKIAKIGTVYPEICDKIC